VQHNDNRAEIADYTRIFSRGLETVAGLKAARPDTVLVYVHLPKAAGNASIGALRDHFTPYVSVDWRQPMRHMEEIVASWTNHQVRFISGHIHHDVLEVIRTSSLPQVRMTFIRHPVDRIISSYRYRSSARSPRQEANLARHPTLEHYVFEAVKTNEIARFMLGKDVRSLDEYERGMKKFSFIGVSELLPLSHLVLSRLLDIPYARPELANVTDNPQVSARPSQQVLDHLYATQQMDVMFHSRILSQYCRLSAELIGTGAEDCYERPWFGLTASALRFP
jgi:hypothetical protein